MPFYADGIVYAFIDSQNLNLAIRDQGWVLDFKRFRAHLAARYRVEKAFLFIGYVEKNQNLYRYLERCGYILIYKYATQLPEGGMKGNVDAELVLQAMIEYSNYDKAVIVSGDGDFACLVEYLANNGKLRALLVPNQSRYSILLKKSAAGKLDFLNNLQKRLGKTVKTNTTR